MGLALVFSLTLLFNRLDLLKSRNELDSFISRESTFLLNNLILVGMAFTVLLGVLFPILSEAVTGNKVTVGPPFFNTVMVPIGLLLLFVTGVCPLIAWRRATFSNLRKNLIYPAATAAVAFVALFALGVRGFYPLLSFTLSAFVLAHRRSRVRPRGMGAAPDAAGERGQGLGRPHVAQQAPLWRVHRPHWRRAAARGRHRVVGVQGEGRPGAHQRPEHDRSAATSSPTTVSTPTTPTRRAWVR